jgi:hypothetical protein
MTSMSQMTELSIARAFASRATHTSNAMLSAKKATRMKTSPPPHAPQLAQAAPAAASGGGCEEASSGATQAIEASEANQNDLGDVIFASPSE